MGRSLYKDIINGHLISTVKLPFDHGWLADKPLWYETMVFAIDDEGNSNFLSLYSDRCSTEEESKEMHKKAQKWVLEKMNIDDEFLNFLNQKLERLEELVHYAIPIKHDLEAFIKAVDKTNPTVDLMCQNSQEHIRAFESVLRNERINEHCKIQSE
jgi:hypothetical protein